MALSTTALWMRSSSRRAAAPFFVRLHNHQRWTSSSSSTLACSSSACSLLNATATKQPKQQPRRMSFHFATTEYASCFRDLPQPDTVKLRKATLSYLERFNAEMWFQDPIVSLLKGEKLEGTPGQDDSNEVVDTVNALGTVNGRQKLAGKDQIAQLKSHIQTYQSSYTDLREPIRKIEHMLLTQFAGSLIGNQCLDFQKQDGITEIEEAVMANAVERRLNDLLLQEEASKHVVVNRQPIYISAVSNFTNFLDLSRKCLRSLELGIPVIVLSRTQTSQQHSYRWTQLLLDLCWDAGIDPGMVTFVSASLNDIKDITNSCQASTGNLYTTCSRDLAADITKSYPKTIASTGGPNTLVCTDWDPNSANHALLKDAIAGSAAIESAGQCTALRHCVVPSAVPDSDCPHILDGIEHLDAAPTAVREAKFTGVFAGHPANPVPTAEEGYEKHPTADAHLKINSENALPSPGINEFWRKVVVDFSKLDLVGTISDSKQRHVQDKQLQLLAGWLNENQPITLAVNGPRQEVLNVGVKLWERTGLVVNTLGSTDEKSMPPAWSCQARPQEAEVFGEFPPRDAMSQYTRFPVVVPSSNPSYDTVYTEEYLKKKGSALSEYMNKSSRVLLELVNDDAVRGYCVLLVEYLQNVSGMNPKQGYGKSRTTLWGVQRPPLGSKTIIHCGADSSWEDVAPIYILFHVTNARDQVELSVDGTNETMIKFCQTNKLDHCVETKEELANRAAARNDIFHLVHVAEQPSNTFAMAGNFVSLYFPFGHVKSTMQNDEEFALKAMVSDKWLQTVF